MSSGLALGLSIGLLAAFASIALGRNLTRSITAGMIAVAGLSMALVSADAGFVGLVVLTIATLVLATIQLFGWMLVDVERDHVPPTDRATRVARGLAFLLLGAGLAVLSGAALDRGALAPVEDAVGMSGPRVIGELLFGAWRDLATLCGLALSAGLLAALMLLHDDSGGR